MINEEKFYTPKLRVLVLTPGLAPGGAEAWLASLMRHSCTVQYVRTIAVTKAPLELVVDLSGCPVTVCKESEVNEVVDAVVEQYDIIMYWGLANIDLRFTGRPILHVIHFSANEDTNEGHEWYRITFGATDANYLACVSQSGVEAFQKSKRAKTVVKVIHNGADVERSRPIHGAAFQRKQWGLSDDQVACLYVGRLVQGKGPEKLINALAYLPDNYVAVILGWGVMASDLRRMASIYPGRVIFPQPRMHALGDVYAGSDVLVIPSTSEAFPMVLLEGWQSGIPVVCSGFDTVHELEDKHGFDMVEPIPCPPTPQDVATGVLGVTGLESPEAAALNERVAKCLQLAMTEYTASAMAGRWETFFYQIQHEWMAASQYGVVEKI